MTDNGGTAGVPVFNAGMRARKTQLYDGGHRVPCFVRWPVAGLRSRDIAVPSQMQDILPTLTDLCGLKKLGGSRFDGQSLAELVRGSRQALEDRMLVVQYGQILKEWDSCVIWGRWRLVKRDELYDIQADPGQQHNVAAQQPEIVRRMRARYEKWWDGVEPTLGDFCPISLGTEQENPVLLSCSDWLEIYCDNVQSVLNGAGGSRGGPWSVEVEKEGSYDIAVARWPFERSLALSAPCPRSPSPKRACRSVNRT
jgi:arylsulfatase